MSSQRRIWPPSLSLETLCVNLLTTPIWLYQPQMNPLVIPNSSIYRTDPSVTSCSEQLEIKLWWQVVWSCFCKQYRRRRRRAAEPALYCQDSSAAAAWGCWAWSLRTSSLSFSDSWRRALRQNYALRVFRSQELNNAALQNGYRATIVAHLTYAASAWRGFIKSSDRQRIYCDRPRSTSWILFAGHIYVWWTVRHCGRWTIFSKAVRLSYHLLRPLLSPSSTGHCVATFLCRALA